jgi:hypothetical protein
MFGWNESLSLVARWRNQPYSFMCTVQDTAGTIHVKTVRVSVKETVCYLTCSECSSPREGCLFCHNPVFLTGPSCTRCPSRSTTFPAFRPTDNCIMTSLGTANINRTLRLQPLQSVEWYRVLSSVDGINSISAVANSQTIGYRVRLTPTV